MPSRKLKPVKPERAGPWRWASGAVALVRAPLEWIGRNEQSVLIALLLIVLALWGFWTLAGEVSEGGTKRFDEWALRSLRHADNPAKPLGPEWLAEVGRDMTALGGIAILTMLTLAVAGFLWLRRMYGAMWLVLVATLGGLLVSHLLKGAFDRPRPSLVPHLTSVSTSSFPSGHSMLSAVVYLTLGTLIGRFVPQLRLKAYFLLIALLLTMLVGVSRVYLGVHYPTDVLAGWAAGLAWALACWLVARLLQKQGAVEKDIENKDAA